MGPPCPKCGSDLDMGYGLAMGGGIGPYVFCTNDACDYFEKFIDPEMDDQPPKNKKDSNP